MDNQVVKIPSLQNYNFPKASPRPAQPLHDHNNECYLLSVTHNKKSTQMLFLDQSQCWSYESVMVFNCYDILAEMLIWQRN